MCNRKVQVGRDPPRCTSIVASIAQQRPLSHENFLNTRWESILDIVGFSAGGGHMRVIQPYLAAWIQRIVRHALNNSADPVILTIDIAIVSGIHRNGARRPHSKHVYPLMA